MDESQLELSRSLVQDFKTFKFDIESEESHKLAEKQAKEFKKQKEETTGKVYSDVGHMDNYFYVGYAEAGELATKAVTEAGKYYGLNIELTAGYMLGNSWSSCH